MTPAPKLSSDRTIFAKWIFPGAFLAGWPGWLFNAVSHGGAEWIPAVMWTIFSVWLVIWSRPIKFVTLRGDSFVISNYFSTHSVLTSSLIRIKEDRHNRTPTIMLYFEPPTAFGPRVRILPPVGFLSRAAFDDVSCYLHSLLNANNNIHNA